MDITVPTNFPTGDRRTVRVVPLATLDPLHDSARRPMPALPVDMAVRLARAALGQHEGVSIHDHDAMVSAATALDGVLRDVLAALDAESAERAA
ncbi:hypothetical protein [Streptomyces sp. NPDC058758]|uniref:hypothetical protein n=1 Tax=Streptomyces sp. NPDC058758 TaxID=3346627 RepID=UPI003674A8AA